MISYYKGQFLDSKNIHINEKLFRGIGIFETIKFINNKMLFFNDHMDRLFSNNTCIDRSPICIAEAPVTAITILLIYS